MDANEAKLARLRGLGTQPREPFDPSSLRRGVLLRAEVGTIDPRLWTQVRRGWWIGKAEWNGLTPADLLAAKAHATQLSSTRDLIFSHFTAAALLGLPVFSSHQVTVVQLADPLSMSPGESYSRALMYLHGIPRPELQIHLEDDAGEIGFGDFGWQRLLERPLVVGEFDGQYKYGVNTALSSEEVGRRLMREKDRENRIRLAGPVVVRWTWADLMNPQQFLNKLRAVGVQPGTGAPWIADAAA